MQIPENALDLVEAELFLPVGEFPPVAESAFAVAPVGDRKNNFYRPF
jgi:hypothetical protein